MNDRELDQLLDAWKAPAAPRPIGKRLKGGFARQEWRSPRRPLILVLLALTGSVVLTVAIAQDRDTRSGVLGQMLNQARTAYVEYFLEPREVERAARIVAKIRQSNPMVYVNGKLAGPLEYGTAGSMELHVPDGVYSLMLYQYVREKNSGGRPTGWLEAGHIHGKSIEFQVGNQRVRVECDEDLVERDRGVFIRRLE